MSERIGPRRILAAPGLRGLYVWTFLSKLSVLTPFFALFLAHRHEVGTVEITLLFATYSATRLLSEVPLGALADRIGETPTLRLSSTLALAAVICLVSGPLSALFVGQVLFALSESASSGVQESLLYRLSDNDETRGVPYRQAQPAFHSAGWSGIVCAGALGTLIVAASLELLSIAAVLVAVLALLLSIFLPGAHARTDGGDREALRIRTLFEALVRVSRFHFWFLTGGCCSFILTVTYFTIQPLLNEIEQAGPGNGLLYSAVTVFAAWGAHLTNRLNDRFATRRVALFSALALLVVAILGLRWSETLAMVFFSMAGLRFAWGWVGATCTTALNEAVPVDGLRATVLSAQSLFTGLLSTVSLAVFAAFGLSAGTILILLAAMTAGGSVLIFILLVGLRAGGESDAQS